MLKSLTLNNLLAPVAPRKQSLVAARKITAPVQPWQRVTAVVLAVFALLLLGSYLISVNSYAATGYQIKQMQSKLSDLNDENMKLSVKASQISSMVTVQSEVLGADFVAAGNPQFLQVPSVNKYSER